VAGEERKLEEDEEKHLKGRIVNYLENVNYLGRRKLDVEDTVKLS